MNISHIPPDTKVLIAATTGSGAQEILRHAHINAHIFHQNTVIDGKRAEMDANVEETLRRQAVSFHEVPQQYGRSLMSAEYRAAARAVSQGTKVCFELMLYALERGVIHPGETIYAAAGCRSGTDTLVEFIVPDLMQFHAGGYQEFTVFDANPGAVAHLRNTLMSRNKYLPIILLYHPKAYPQRDYAWTPFSVLAIASVVPKTKYYPYILDNNHLCAQSHLQELQAIAYKLQLVGISSMIGHQISDMIQFLGELRSISRDIPVVVGGALPTILGEMTLEHEDIDFIVRSQGEVTFQELLQALEQPEDWSLIQGLGFKADGNATLNPLRPVQKKANFPPYAFDLIDLSRYIRPAGSIGQRVLSYISSQGCPFSCAFCSDMLIYQKKWTSRSEEQIIDDLKFFRDAYDVDGVKFYDSNLLVSHSRAERFCRAIADADLGLNYATSIHPRVMANLSPETLELLRKSGCKRLLIGTESGNEHELLLIRKGATVADMIESARRLRDLEIVGTFTLIIGLPGTTVDALQQSVDLGQEISSIWPEHEVKMQVYQPYPGTELYDKFRVPGAYEPQSLRDWSLEAFDTTPSPHRDIEVYLEKVRRRHPHLFDELRETSNA